MTEQLVEKTADMDEVERRQEAKEVASTPVRESLPPELLELQTEVNLAAELLEIAKIYQGDAKMNKIISAEELYKMALQEDADQRLN